MDSTTQNDELYHKYRPRSLKRIVGQPEAVEALAGMLASGSLPHAVLLSGPSGVGKTTIARVLAAELGCGGADCVEANAADDRGIDAVRRLRTQVPFRGLNGSKRIWILDECHQFTGEAQSALLKVLEDTPAHAYFFLCTTEPGKLLRTVRTRCTEVALRAIPRDDLLDLLGRVCRREGIDATGAVLERVADCCGGSARQALVLLGRIRHLATEAARLEAVQPEAARRAAIDLVRLLLWEGKPSWVKAASVIGALDPGEDWEGIRRMVLKLAGDEMLKCGKNTARAAAILGRFLGNWYDDGRAGLLAAVHDCLAK